MHSWAKQKAFTIVELLIVIVVIAILAAVTIVAYTGIQDRARQSSAQSALSQVTKQVEAARVTSGTEQYPATLAVANIPTPDGVSYTTSVSRAGYCLVATAGTFSYYTTHLNAQPTQGTCTTADGLVAWWPFNASGAELSGSAISTFVDAPVSAVGQGGSPATAYAFDGVDDQIESPGAPPLVLDNATGSFTFSLWYNATHASNSDVRFIFSRRSTDSSSSTDYVMFITGSTLIFGSGAGDDCAWPSDTAPAAFRVTEPSRNTWHHVVATINQTGAQAGRKTVWVDGTKQTDCAYTHKAAAGSAVFRIGARQGLGSAGTYFRGSLDDFRIYNRVLSDSEIASLYGAGAQ